MLNRNVELATINHATSGRKLSIIKLVKDATAALFWKIRIILFCKQTPDTSGILQPVSR